MKVTIAIATFNRKPELEIMAFSLKKLENLEKFNLKIFDDKSSDYDKGFLKKLFPTAEIIIRKENLKADKNMNLIHKDFLKSNDDYLLQVDSDVIFNKDFFSVIQKIVSENRKEVFSLYNSNNHNFLEKNNLVRINEIDFKEKKSIGGICVLFPREILKNIVENVPKGKNYDWRWSEYLHKNNIKILVSQKSYLQHMGILNGQNSSKSNMDFGIGFKNDILELQDIIELYYKNLIENFIYYKHNLSFKEKLKIINPLNLISIYTYLKNKIMR